MSCLARAESMNLPSLHRLSLRVAPTAGFDDDRPIPREAMDHALQLLNQADLHKYMKHGLRWWKENGATVSDAELYKLFRQLPKETLKEAQILMDLSDESDRNFAVSTLLHRLWEGRYDERGARIQDQELTRALDAIENARLSVEPTNYVHPAARAAFDEFVVSLPDNSVVRNHAAEWIARMGLNHITRLMQLLARDLTVQFSTFGVLPTDPARVAVEAARLEADFMDRFRRHMEDDNEYVVALAARDNLQRWRPIRGVSDGRVGGWLAVGGLNRVATELVAAQRATYPDVDYGISQDAQARSVRQGMAFRLEAIRRDELRSLEALRRDERPPNLDRQRTRDQVLLTQEESRQQRRGRRHL